MGLAGLAWQRDMEHLMNDYHKIFDAWEAGGVDGMVIGPLTFDSPDLIKISEECEPPIPTSTLVHRAESLWWLLQAGPRRGAEGQPSLRDIRPQPRGLRSVWRQHPSCRDYRPVLQRREQAAEPAGGSKAPHRDADRRQAQRLHHHDLPGPVRRPARHRSRHTAPLNPIPQPPVSCPSTGHLTFLGRLATSRTGRTSTTSSTRSR